MSSIDKKYDILNSPRMFCIPIFQRTGSTWSARWTRQCVWRATVWRCESSSACRTRRSGRWGRWNASRCAGRPRWSNRSATERATWPTSANAASSPSAVTSSSRSRWRIGARLRHALRPTRTCTARRVCISRTLQPGTLAFDRFVHDATVVCQYCYFSLDKLMIEQKYDNDYCAFSRNTYERMSTYFQNIGVYREQSGRRREEEIREYRRWIKRAMKEQATKTHESEKRKLLDLLDDNRSRMPLALVSKSGEL